MDLRIQCATCDGLLDPDPFRTSTRGLCSHCNTRIDVRLFPAVLDENHTPQLGQRVTEDDQATCFFHGESQAEVSCDHCGRFLCGLCTTPFRGATWCPQCISQGMSGKVDAFKHRYTMWDTTAASVCVLPIFLSCGYLTFISAPVALFLSIFWWKRPSGILPRSKVRHVLTILFSLVQIGAWIALVIMIGTSIAEGF